MGAHSSPYSRAAVLGAGSWGTALALHLHRQNIPTCLWTRSTEHHQELVQERANRRYLPQFPLPEGLQIEFDLAAAIAGADILVLAVPSHGLRAIVRQVNTLLVDGAGARESTFLIAVKGVESETLHTMADVVKDELSANIHAPIAVLGGPSFAVEVARGLPTAVVVASSAPYLSAAHRIQQQLSGHGLRVYVSDDVLGVELGGAFKNVIALATGVCEGAGLGLNARAAVMTRGLAEISRLSIHLGAHPATLSGLAGLGDLILTCTGELSRNRRVGIALGQGRKLADILHEMGMVAEGVQNTGSAYRMAKQQGIEMPITNMMYAILYQQISVQDALNALMQRELKSERD